MIFYRHLHLQIDEAIIVEMRTKQNSHILGISETYTNNIITNAGITLDGYTIERKDRQKSILRRTLLY